MKTAEGKTAEGGKGGELVGKNCGQRMENGVKNKKEGSNFRVKPANYMPKTQDKNVLQTERAGEKKNEIESKTETKLSAFDTGKCSLEKHEKIPVKKVEEMKEKFQMKIARKIRIERKWKCSWREQNVSIVLF